MIEKSDTPKPGDWMNRIDAAYYDFLAERLHDRALRQKLENRSGA
jgi:hypothetical protein